MNVLVCVKQIPDPADPGELDPETKTLKRTGKIILDETDSYGVEMALQLVEAAGGGTVTAVSMVADGEVGGLRTALAMGVDDAIVVSDPALDGTDALGTARVLAAAMKDRDVDLILTGTESTDGYTGTVPQQLAALLGMPAVTFANHVEVGDGTVTVHRQSEGGYVEVEAPTPAVVSVTSGVVEPRYPSFKGIMAAKKKPVQQVSLADLGVDESQVGWTGARQEIISVAPAEAREAGEIIEDDGEAHQRIVAFLEANKVI